MTSPQILAVLDRITDPTDGAHRTIRSRLTEARGFIGDVLFASSDKDKDDAEACLACAWDLVDEALDALNDIAPERES